MVTSLALHSAGPATSLSCLHSRQWPRATFWNKCRNEALFQRCPASTKDEVVYNSLHGGTQACALARSTGGHGGSSTAEKDASAPSSRRQALPGRASYMRRDHLPGQSFTQSSWRLARAQNLAASGLQALLSAKLHLARAAAADRWPSARAQLGPKTISTCCAAAEGAPSAECPRRSMLGLAALHG
jgi:hypothetical protein